MFWATPSCRPAADMMILKVDPGASWSWIALFISGWRGSVMIFFAHFAYVPHQVRRKAVAGIKPPFFINGFKLRQFVAMGLDERLLVRCNVLLDGDRLIPRRNPEVMQGGAQLVEVEVQALRNH